MKNLQLFLLLFCTNLIFAQSKISECSYKGNLSFSKKCEALSSEKQKFIISEGVLNVVSENNFVETIFKIDTKGNKDLQVEIEVLKSPENLEVFTSADMKHWVSQDKVNIVKSTKNLVLTFSMRSNKKQWYLRLKDNSLNKLSIVKLSVYSKDTDDFLLHVAD